MTRATKKEMLERIVDAVVRVAVDKGIGAAGMADIAKAAKVSAGTLYLHFDTKGDMLQATYLRIKQDFHARLMQAAEADGSEVVIRAMWENTLTFLQERPDHFLFLEYAGAAQVLTPDQKALVAPLQAEVNALIQTAIDDGTLDDMPLGVAVNLLIGPAMHLARKAAMAGTPPNRKEVDQTFARLWACLRTH